MMRSAFGRIGELAAIAIAVGLVLAPTAGAAIPAAAAAAGEWDMFGYDTFHTASNPNVRPFVSVSGTWSSASLDGAVYAEPLVSRGLVIAATENNTIYGLNESTGATVWSLHLATPVQASALGCGNIGPVVGITGTPVIDPVAGVIYAVGLVNKAGKLQYQLFSVGLNGTQVAVPRAVNPAGMDPRFEGQRAALAMGSGFVYVAYGGRFGDCGAYHPIVVAAPIAGHGFITYSPQTAGMNEAGIWGASGIAEDTLGRLYVSTGNGSQGSCSQPWDFSEAVVKLSSHLKQLSYGVPSNWCAMNAADADVGSLGPVLIDQGKKVFQSGKTGEGWVRSVSALGGIDTTHTGKQFCSAGVFGGAAYLSPYVYAPCGGTGVVALKVDKPSVAPFTVAWSSSTSFDPGPPTVAGGVVWSIQIGGGHLYGFDPLTGVQKFSIAIGSANHFAAPSADGNQVFVPLANSIEGVAFITS